MNFETSNVKNQNEIKNKIHVFIVEDDIGLNNLIKRKLKREDIEVKSFFNGTELLENIEDLEKSLILLDYILPDMNASQLINEIHRKFKRIPLFIIMTGQGDEKTAVDMMKLGAKDYLIKDVNLMELLPHVIKKTIDDINKDLMLIKSRRDLSQSEDKFRKIFNYAYDGILLCDIDGNIVDANQKIMSLLNFNFWEITKHNLCDLYTDKEKNKFSNHIKRLKKNRDISINIDLKNKQNEDLPFKISASIIEIDNSEIIQCIIHDISAEKKLDEEREFLIMQLNILNQNIEMKNMLKDVTYLLKQYTNCNAVGIRLFDDYDFPFLVSHSLDEDFIEKEKELYKEIVNTKGILKRVIDNNCLCGKVVDYNFENHNDNFTENGSFWTNSYQDLNYDNSVCNRNTCVLKGFNSIAIIPLIKDNNVFGSINLYDREKNKFTDYNISFLERLSGILSIGISRKKAEEYLRRSYDILEDKVKERTKEIESFTYSVSHDLKAPLRAIDGFAKFLIEDYGDKLDEEANRYISTIKNNVKIMNQLIEGLLKLSRIGRKKLDIQEINIQKIIEEIIEKEKFENENKEINFVIDKALPIVFGDLTLIKQIFVNIINNSVKYTSKKDKAIIEIQCKDLNEYNQFTIKDNGIGFDMKFKDKLFEVFQRLHSNSNYEGMGIGLSIVKRIVERHNGQIFAESENNKGATFIFNLPKTYNEV